MTEDTSEMVLSHFNSGVKVVYDVGEILSFNGVPLPQEQVYKLNAQCSISFLVEWRCLRTFLPAIERFKVETKYLIRMLSASDRQYGSTLLFSGLEDSSFVQEMLVLELQPLIRVHKFGFPLRLPFQTFLDNFQLLETDKSAKSLRERCLQLLLGVSSLRTSDYVVTETHVFMKHDKERAVVSALWEKTGRDQRSYSRSRAQTCGELFPRGMEMSNLLERYTKCIEELEGPFRTGPEPNQPRMSIPEVPEVPEDIFDDPRLRSESIYFQSPPIVVEEPPEPARGTIPAYKDERVDALASLEGKGRALLVMMSALGQYDRMQPVLQCMRIVFSSAAFDPAWEDRKQQLSQAIETFHISAYQSEKSILHYDSPKLSTQVGGVYGEVHRLETLVDEMHRHRNGVIQYERAAELISLSKRRLEHELYTQAHYRNFDFMTRIVQSLALLWRSGDPQESIREYIISQGIIELLLVLLADVSSNYSLKCTIAVTIRLLSSHPHVIRWFAEGNGIRCFL